MRICANCAKLIFFTSFLDMLSIIFRHAKYYVYAC